MISYLCHTKSRLFFRTSGFALGTKKPSILWPRYEITKCNPERGFDRRTKWNEKKWKKRCYGHFCDVEVDTTLRSPGFYPPITMEDDPCCSFTACCVFFFKAIQGVKVRSVNFGKESFIYLKFEKLLFGKKWSFSNMKRSKVLDYKNLPDNNMIKSEFFFNDCTLQFDLTNLPPI